jgi:hypothetical protein
MNELRPWIALINALALTLALSGYASAQPTERPIERFSWLVGGVWTADASTLGNDMQQIATRYQWAPNKTYISFFTTFTTKTTSFVNYSGNLYVQSDPANPGQPVYTMWYTNAENEVTQGVVALESGDNWSETFVSDRRQYRVDILREGKDSYRWILMSKSGAAWQRVISLEFVRGSR